MMMTTMTTTSTSVAKYRTVTIRAGWFTIWAAVATLAAFQVIKHGYVQGEWTDAFLLTTTAVVFFVAPDLTLLVGIGEPVNKGYLPTRAVPFYNAAHRFWPPLLLTIGAGVWLAPLSTIALALFVGGLSWMAHVALDRTTGYGLRNSDGSR
jgi:hypothetical protein